jgi:large subunit ribosomal protein L21e
MLLALLLTNELRTKLLPREINVCIEHIRHSKSQNSSLKCMKENDQKKTQVQLKCQPALPREAHFMRTNGKETELLEYIPYKCM